MDDEQKRLEEKIQAVKRSRYHRNIQAMYEGSNIDPELLMSRAALEKEIKQLINQLRAKIQEHEDKISKSDSDTDGSIIEIYHAIACVFERNAYLNRQFVYAMEQIAIALQSQTRKNIVFRNRIEQLEYRPTRMDHLENQMKVMTIVILFLLFAVLWLIAQKLSPL